MGIVGLPNVGKSSLFNALTERSVKAENFPFCTIDPEEGKIEYPDDRFDFLVNLHKPDSQVSAFLTVHDIAGLIKGASEGLGLGNQFLDQISRTDGILHVVRCFDDENIVHVDETVDPIRDVKTINDELRFKDLELIKRRIEKQKRETVTDPTKKKFETATLAKLEKVLQIKWAIDGDWKQDEADFISTFNLLTTKKVIYLANISDEEYKEKTENKHLKALKKLGKNVIEFSATDVDGEFIRKLMKCGYDSLNLITYFTASKKEVKAWTIRKGTKAPQAAAVIHTDFEKNFIKAEIMSFADLEKHGNEANVKKAGKYYLKGKDYVVDDGNVILFKIGQGSKSKKKK